MEDQNEDESPKKNTLWQVGMTAHRSESSWFTLDKMPLSSCPHENKSQAVLCFLHVILLVSELTLIYLLILREVSLWIVKILEFSQRCWSDCGLKCSVSTVWVRDGQWWCFVTSMAPTTHQFICTEACVSLVPSFFVISYWFALSF